MVATGDTHESAALLRCILGPEINLLDGVLVGTHCDSGGYRLALMDRRKAFSACLQRGSNTRYDDTILIIPTFIPLSVVSWSSPTHTHSATETVLMSAQWYYMASGWFNKTRRVGPITEQDLLVRIDQGKVQPETLVQSSKTKNRWVPMSTVGPAMDRWQTKHSDPETA